jgi:transcriptional regulator with PAS, ATPase and Fis domain
MPLKQTMEMFARAYVDAALEFSHGSVTQAGQLINVHRNTIARWAKLK